MKFLISRDRFLDALDRIHSSVEKKSTVPILGSLLFNVKGGEVSLFATDLEVGMRTSVQAIHRPGIVAEDGQIAIPAKTMLDIVRELPAGSEILLTRTQNEWVELKCEEYRFNLLGFPAHAYLPESSLPHFEEKPYFPARQRTLADMIDRTLCAISTDTAFFHLNGVCLEQVEGSRFRMTSTNMYRLSSVEGPLFARSPEIRKGMIIPKKGLLELRKLLHHQDEGRVEGRSDDALIGLSFERGYLYARLDTAGATTYLFIRLIEGEYVDYRRIIPQDLKHLAVLDRERFATDLRRVSLLASERGRRVKLKLSNDQLLLSCTNPEFGEATARMSIQYSGPEVEMGFNPRYLLEGLQTFTSDAKDVGSAMSQQTPVELLFNDPLKPAILREAGSQSHFYVIMPMRV